MRKRNLLLFTGIVIMTLVWGAVYWYLVVPIIDPR